MKGTDFRDLCVGKSKSTSTRALTHTRTPTAGRRVPVSIQAEAEADAAADDGEEEEEEEEGDGLGDEEGVGETTREGKEEEGAKPPRSPLVLRLVVGGSARAGEREGKTPEPGMDACVHLSLPALVCVCACACISLRFACCLRLCFCICTRDGS